MAEQPQSRYLRVAAARADFLDSGDAGAAGVPDVLAASWRRSVTAGVDTDRPASNYDAVDLTSRLVRCTRPILDQLATDISDMDLVIAVTDHKARLIERVDVSSSMGRLLDRVEFAPGFTYAEDTMGTNGVGTVIESGRAISIVGPEHFSEHLQQFACTGAPIIDPLTGRLEGILDVSTVVQSWSPLVHTLAKSAAKDISRNLLLDRNLAQQAVFETYLRADARAGTRAVFGFSESVVMANAAAQTLFSADEQSTIRDHASFVMRHRDRVSDAITLTSGREVALRGTRIMAGAAVAGIVVIAEPARRETTIAPAQRHEQPFADQLLPDMAVTSPHTKSLITDIRTPRGPIANSTSPAWRSACSVIHTAMVTAEPTIIIGEPGSGRFTLGAEIFHVVRPTGRSVCVDASQLNEGVGLDLDSLLDNADSGDSLLILRDIDALKTPGLRQARLLLAAAAESDPPVTVVATATEAVAERADLPSHALLGAFAHSVTLPPLRCRTEDLPAIVGRLVHELAPHRRVRLSPAAERAIASYAWPRNVDQLRDALAAALRVRPVGEIQVEDLPRYCHTNARAHHLTPLQIAERDAIVAALQEHHGNRVAAAAHVGMSRSSLYRKINSYGITG